MRRIDDSYFALSLRATRAVGRDIELQHRHQPQPQDGYVTCARHFPSKPPCARTASWRRCRPQYLDHTLWHLQTVDGTFNDELLLMRLGNVSRELTCCVVSERAALVCLLCLILCSHAEGSSCERYLIRRDSPMHCVRDSEHPDCTMSQLSPSDPCDDSAFVTFAPVELYWQSKQEFLQSQGYNLRPRYVPGWIPSWRIDPTIWFADAEDHVGFHVKSLCVVHDETLKS